MTTIIKRKFRLSRRIGSSLWGSAKDPVHKRNYRPGQNGRTAIKKFSDFGRQSTAHKCFKTYYAMGGKQFSRIFHSAYKAKGNTGNNLIALLETRISSVLFHANLVTSIFAAKQLVSHKHVIVNGSVVNVNNYHIKEGDLVELRDRVKNIPCVTLAVDAANKRSPAYLHVDYEKRSVKLIRVPEFVDVPYATVMEPHLVIEYYSK